MKTLKESYSYYGLILGLLLLAFFIYTPTFQYELFIFDDLDHYGMTQQIGSKSLIAMITEHKTFMPVFYKLWEQTFQSSQTYHRFNLRFFSLVIHLINVILLYFALTRFLKLKEFSAALISLLFFLHPAHIESVVWISSVKGTLATLFCLLSLLLWHFHLKSHHKLLFWLSYGISFFCYVLALLTKVTVILFPLLYLLYDHHQTKKLDKGLLLKLIPFSLAGALLGLYQVWTYQPGIEHHALWYITQNIYHFRYYLIGLGVIACGLFFYYLMSSRKNETSFKKKFLVGGATFIAMGIILPLLRYYDLIYLKIKTFLVVLLFSLYKMLFPYAYSLDYNINQDLITQDISLFSFIAIVLSFTFFLTMLIKKVKGSLYYILAFIAFSLPHLGLFTFGFSKVSYYADRYAYLPLLPLLLGLFLLVQRTSIGQVKKGLMYLGVLSIFFSFSVYNRDLWQSNESVLKHSIEYNPKSIALKMALAQDYTNRDLIPDAIDTYKQLTFQHQDYAGSYLTHLKLLIELKEYQEAVDWGSVILERNSSIHHGLFFLIGQAYFYLGDESRSLIYLSKAQHFYPRNEVLMKMLKQLEKASRLKDKN